MERTVLFRDRQELQSADLNNIQTFARSSLDHVVNDAIEPGKAYAGFSVTKTGATELTVAAGRLYSAGLVYARDENVVLDTFNILPLVTQKRIAIVAWGQSVDTDVQPRDFLIDAQTGETEPQSVAMENLRFAQVNIVAGVEASDPQYPTTDSNVTVLAYALLTTEGVQNVEQVVGNHLANLKNVDGRAAALETWRGLIGARVNTLATDLSAIQERLKSYTLLEDFYKMNDRLIEVEKEIAKPKPPVNEFVGFWDDHFLDATGTDEEFTGYAATVEEGIRFPFAASTSAVALSLLNPTEPLVAVNSGFVLPKYTSVARLTTPGYDGETDISTAGTYTTQEVRQLTRTSTVLRYGAMLSVCSNNAMWSNIRYNAIDRTFAYQGQTYEFSTEQDYQNWLSRRGTIRYRQVWRDTISEPYWDVVTTTATVQGSILAQTVLWSQTAWLSQIGLYFTRVGASGDVTVMVTETNLGQPDMSRVLSRVTLPRTSIQTAGGTGGTGLPAAVRTNVPIPPVLLMGGRRYAIAIVSAGQHYVATSKTDNSVMNGTLFRSSDAGYFLGDLLTDLKLDLFTAQFERNRIAVEFNTFQLSGGASRVDIHTDTALPPSTDITYEIYLSGQWQPLATDGTGPALTSLPAIVRLRAVFSGTLDLMPGMSINPSEVRLYRDATALTWFSDVKTASTSAEQIKVTARLESWETGHTVTATLRTGETYTTVETADVTEDVTVSPGVILRTWTFAISPGATQYRVALAGMITSIAAGYHVAKLTGTEYTTA